MVSISAFHYIVTGMTEMQGVWQGDRMIRQTLTPPTELQFDVDSHIRQQISIVSVECESVVSFSMAKKLLMIGFLSNVLYKYTCLAFEFL